MSRHHLLNRDQVPFGKFPCHVTTILILCDKFLGHIRPFAQDWPLSRNNQEPFAQDQTLSRKMGQFRARFAPRGVPFLARQVFRIAHQPKPHSPCWHRPMACGREPRPQRSRQRDPNSPRLERAKTGVASSFPSSASGAPVPPRNFFWKIALFVPSSSISNPATACSRQVCIFER